LYVADLTAFDTGAVIRIDPSDGSQTLLATGGYIYGPNSIAFLNGFIYVADTGDSSGFTHNLVRIDPNNPDLSTNQTLITDGSRMGDGFTNPVGLAPVLGDPNSLYVGDEPGNVRGSFSGQVWKVNLLTQAQSRFGPQFPTTGAEAHPDRIAVDPTTGNLYASTIGEFGTDGSIVRVDADSLTAISAHDKFVGNNGIRVSPDGTTIYVPTIATSVSARILAVSLLDPTGVQSILAEGGNLSLVAGLWVFQESGAGASARPSGPARAALLISQAKADHADWSLVLPTASAGLNPARWLGQPLPLANGWEVARWIVQPTTTEQVIMPAMMVDFLFVDWDGGPDWAPPILGACRETAVNPTL
jgi:hypothetical protein